MDLSDNYSDKREKIDDNVSGKLECLIDTRPSVH